MTKPGTYRFEILDARGHVCCAGDTPDFPRCARCQTQRMRSAAAFRTAVPLVERKTMSEWCDHFGQLLRGYGSIQPEAPPNPYAAATSKAPTPYDDPRYTPHGTPPDGYAIGLRKGVRR
jgi:hypothetical protein